MKTLSSFWRWLPSITAALALTGPGPALAHKSSDAYLSWTVSGEQVEQRVDIALRDLDRELVLDADGDGQLSWGEIRSRWPEIEKLAAEGIQLSSEGRSCEATAPSRPQLDDHIDGTYVVLQQTLQCAGPVQQLAVDYRLFARTDPTHRGLARLTGTTERTLVLVPGARPASLSGDAQTAAPSGFPGFVRSGVHHIAIGADHVLFLVCLLMVAVWRRDDQGWTPRETARSAWRETLKLVTAFTVAHSVTLTLAATGWLAPPSRWVETLIALSVLLAAIDNIRPFMPGPRWLLVALFGLVHGFGFAGPLQDMGLREGQLALPLLGFNLGVELGQLLIVAALLPLALLLRHTPVYRWGVVRGGSAAVALLALVWTLERGLELQLMP